VIQERNVEVYRLVSVIDTVNANVILPAPGRVLGAYVLGAASGIRYVKLYNKATAPVVGTDTPLVTLQASITAAEGAAFMIAAPLGVPMVHFPGRGLFFSAGIGVGITVGVADSNTSAPSAAGDVYLHVFYQRGR